VVGRGGFEKRGDALGKINGGEYSEKATLENWMGDSCGHFVEGLSRLNSVLDGE